MSYIVKLADVEFASKGVTPLHLTLVDQGTPNWTAPEILEGISPVSPASDVFSLACVLCEIVTFKVPFEEVKTPEAVAELIKRGKRPQLPMLDESSALDSSTSEYRRMAASRTKLCELIDLGWAQNWAARPSAKTLAQDVDALRQAYHKKPSQLHT